MKAIERSGEQLRVELYPNGKARTPVLVWEKDAPEPLTPLDAVNLETAGARQKFVERLPPKTQAEALRLLELAAVELLRVKAEARDSAKSEVEGQGQALAFADPEPCAEPVDGAELLDALVCFIERYLSLPPHASDLLAGYCVATYATGLFETAPYIVLTSPAPECGKTRALEVLELLTARPWLTVTPSTAVLFRVLEQYSPTLLLDEAEVVRGRGEAAENVRALLNSGYRRGAVVPRCVGDSQQARMFAVFGPKGFALIGKLPRPLATRCIHIPMTRKAPADHVERLRRKFAEPKAAELRRKAARWISDNRDALTHAEPHLPDCLSDRHQEVLEPILAVAQVAGGGWPDRLNTAAQTLSETVSDDDAREKLLADLRELFQQQTAESLPTVTILDHLHTLDNRDWPEWGSQKKPITARGLARLLEPFGIHPRKWRDGAAFVRGYEVGQFEEVFQHYLPERVHSSATTPQVNKNAGSGQVPSATEGVGCGGCEPRETLEKTGDVAVWRMNAHTQAEENEAAALDRKLDRLRTEAADYLIGNPGASRQDLLAFIGAVSPATTQAILEELERNGVEVPE